MLTVPQILSQPVALLPQYATSMIESYHGRLVHNIHESHLLERRLEGHPPAQALGDGAVMVQEFKPYDLVEGVALIPISGALMHEDTWWWDETTYSSIAGKIGAAVVDSDVLGIALHINSPGGVVSGCFDLADAVYGLRGEKPIWAIVDEAAYSAAYALASSAERIIVPRTGGVGSVGVICMHVDITKMLEEFGVKVTTVQYGAYKSEGYPTTPLTDDARGRMQADVDVLGEMFVEMVARNRGIDASAVRKTEAGCFLGEAGVGIGFADAVMPVDQALMEFITYVNKEK